VDFNGKNDFGHMITKSILQKGLFVQLFQKTELGVLEKIGTRPATFGFSRVSRKIAVNFQFGGKLNRRGTVLVA